MVAIPAQQVVLPAQEPARHALHDRFDLLRRQEADPVQDRAAEGGAGRRCERWRVVDARFGGRAVAAVGVFD